MKSCIFLKDIEFFAYHGVMEQENIVGNNYTLNLSLNVDISCAMLSDDVHDSVNYADVFAVVKETMNKPSKLIENVCWRIISDVFSKFTAVDAISLSLEKHNPPMNADIQSAGINIEIGRKEWKDLIR